MHAYAGSCSHQILRYLLINVLKCPLGEEVRVRCTIAPLCLCSPTPSPPAHCSQLRPTQKRKRDDGSGQTPKDTLLFELWYRSQSIAPVSARGPRPTCTFVSEINSAYAEIRGARRTRAAEHINSDNDNGRPFASPINANLSASSDCNSFSAPNSVNGPNTSDSDTATIATAETATECPLHMHRLSPTSKSQTSTDADASPLSSSARVRGHAYEAGPYGEDADVPGDPSLELAHTLVEALGGCSGVQLLRRHEMEVSSEQAYFAGVPGRRTLTLSENRFWFTVPFCAHEYESPRV